MMSVLQKINGRYSAGQKIETYLFDGEGRFKKSGGVRRRRMVRRRGRMSG